jgi:abortive infection bacteriophage resistance protein
MTSKVYNKPPLTLDQQAELLLNRGLQGVSKEELIAKLSRVGYYRLRGYTYPYQNNSLDNSPFLPNACWAYIQSDYIFDSKLRNLVVEALGHIEIAVRSQLAYQMAITYGSRWYEDPTLCHSERLFSENLTELKKHWLRSREVFKQHYESEYDTAVSPPAWMIFETTTFGTVSKIFSNLNNNVVAKTKIANYFGFNRSSIKVLTSWFQHLNLVRNICAHYSRLFTRSFIVRPMIPKGKPAKWTNTIPSQDRIYLSICIIITLLDICSPKHDFRNRLKSIMKMIRVEQLPSLGFPEDWQKQDLFRC